MSVESKVVIITGASSGIGEASAKLLAKNGAKLVLGARRTERIKEIADQIIKAGGQATYRSTDVTKPQKLKHWFSWQRINLAEWMSFLTMRGSCRVRQSARSMSMSGTQ